MTSHYYWRFVLCALAMISALGASVTNSSGAEPPTTRELLDKIDALQSQVKDLKAQVEGVTRAQSVENAGARDAVRDDAQRRSQLVDLERFTAGYRAEQGFLLQSEDGRFLLHPWVVMQIRNETTYREDGKSGGRSDTQNGFELRRMKLIFDGNLFDPGFTYQFIFGVDRHNGNLALEDAWARWKPGNAGGLYLRGGQIRDLLDHEQITFAPRLVATERTLVNSLFANGEGIVQGASIGFDNDGPVRGEFALTDGMRSANTTFQDFPANAADWGLAGRVDWKLAGDWKEYSSLSALGAKSPLLVIGGGADFTEAGDTQQLTHVADLQLTCPCGLSIYGAYLGRYVNHNSGGIGTNGGSSAATPTFDSYDATARAQVAYLFKERVEPFVRYEYLNLNRRELPATAHHGIVHEFTTGVGYYLYRQRAKLTADASYLPNGCPVGDDASGVLATNGNNEVVIRIQFQLIL